MDIVHMLLPEDGICSYGTALELATNLLSFAVKRTESRSTLFSPLPPTYPSPMVFTRSCCVMAALTTCISLSQAFQLSKPALALGAKGVAISRFHKSSLGLRHFSRTPALTMSVEDNLKKAGIELPEVAAAAANYVSSQHVSFPLVLVGCVSSCLAKLSLLFSLSSSLLSLFLCAMPSCYIYYHSQMNENSTPAIRIVLVVTLNELVLRCRTWCRASTCTWRGSFPS
eukprot:3808799-Rhodomonas_salina.2